VSCAYCLNIRDEAWDWRRRSVSGRGCFCYRVRRGDILYDKYGSETVGMVTMDMEEYGRPGTYTQSAMIWSGKSRECDDIRV